MSSSVRSWRQRVLEADPTWQRDATRPVVYEFSNGRKFRQPADPYQGGVHEFILDESVLDDGDVLA